MTDSNSEASANDHFLEQTGLLHEPFENQPQEEFFLLDNSRAQRLNMLYHLAQNSELLLLVTGSRGSGKSSLLNRFLDMDTDNWRHCCIHANTMMNPDELLIEIAEGFGLPQDSVNFGNVFDVLPKRLTEMKISELMPVLIIDDAHELPAASLAVIMKLSELSENNERLLRIVLFSEPQITEQLNSPELKEVRHRITHTLDMPLLSEQETIEYITHRLAVAGHHGDLPFTASQLKKIHKLSNGLPGLVNIHAREMLLGVDSSVPEQKIEPSTDRMRSTVLLVSILGITGVVTWYVTQDMFKSIDGHEVREVLPIETRQPLPLLPPSKELAPATVATVGPEAKEEPQSETEPAEAPVKPTPAGSNQINPFALPAPAPTVTKAKVSTPITKPVTLETPEQAPMPVADEIKKPDSADKKVVAVQAKATPPIVDTSKTKPAVKDWLSQQNPAHFTLQIMGSRKRTAVALVQRAHKIDKNSAIVRTSLKGSDWFILVYNNYPTKKAARAATSKLPRALQLTRPWPRKVKDIQSLIK